MLINVQKVERALTLWATGTITTERVQESKSTGKSLILPKMLKTGDGIKATRSTAFTDSAWGDATRGFVESVEKLKPAIFATIITKAKEFSKISRRGGGTTKSSTNDDNAHNNRANLVEASDSDDDSDDACKYINLYCMGR